MKKHGRTDPGFGYGTVISSPESAGALTAIERDLPNGGDGRFIITGSSCLPGFKTYDQLTLQASDAEPPPTEIADTDPYNIIYSSGTTGAPKGIVHTHYIRAIYCMQFASTFRISPESVVLPLPAASSLMVRFSH